jgi:hypothetical protein
MAAELVLCVVQVGVELVDVVQALGDLVGVAIKDQVVVVRHEGISPQLAPGLSKPEEEALQEGLVVLVILEQQQAPCSPVEDVPDSWAAVHPPHRCPVESTASTRVVGGIPKNSARNLPRRQNVEEVL